MAYYDLQHYMENLPETLNSREELEALLGKWKLTLGKIENKPLYAYTTKEVDTLYLDKALHSVLKDIDASIYGKQKSIPKSEASYLLRFSEERLNKIIEQLNSKSK